MIPKHEQIDKRKIHLKTSHTKITTERKHTIVGSSVIGRNTVLNKTKHAQCYTESHIPKQQHVHINMSV